MFESHSQIICTIFGVHIYFYGVILALAIVTGTLVSDYIGEKFYGLKKETMIDDSPYLIIFGIIGARLYYCLLNSDFYIRFPSEILAIRHGGISIHGAILGGFIGLIIFAIRHKISIPKLCDISAIGLILAQAIGRWGNFFNSESASLICLDTLSATYCPCFSFMSLLIAFRLDNAIAEYAIFLNFIFLLILPLLPLL